MIRSLKLLSGLLCFGPYPEGDDFRKLRELNVSLVWNLGRELEDVARLERQELGCEVLTGQINDFRAPENLPLFLSQIEQVLAHLKAGESAFVHCFGGRGRTGMALACLLATRGWEVNAALAEARMLCNGPESIEQIEFVRSYAEQLARD